MRNWFYIGSVLLLFGCEQDEIVPCTEGGPVGELCRTYRYFNEDPIGYIAFEYEEDSAQFSRYFNVHSELEKTVIQRYSDGRLTVIAEQFTDGPSRVQSWHYNDLDSLSLIVYGPNDSSVEITYEEGKRFREQYFSNGALNRYIQYRYFEDDGLLYRVSEFDANDSLTFYSNYNYFSNNGNNVIRVSRFSSENELISRRLFTFSQLGFISSMEYRLADGTLAEAKEYIYDAAGKLIEERGQLSGNISRSIYLYN